MNDHISIAPLNWKTLVAQARAGLAEDDKDYARLTGWLDDLEVVKGGKVVGRFGDTA